MKKSVLLLLLFLYTAFASIAQKTATWKGGTPGQENAWNCPENWREGRVPNEFSSVVIPDVSTSTFSYPVITSGIVEIHSLYCEPSARLTAMPEARIIVHDDPVNKPYVQNGNMVYSGISLEKTIASTARN